MPRQSRRLERVTRVLAQSFVLILALLAAPLRARADVTPPDTPAGQTLRAFFEAFNSGEHDRIAAYVKEYDPENNADGLTSFSNQTGGFTLVSILHSAPDRLLPRTLKKYAST